MKLEKFTAGLVNQAVEIYLAHAYEEAAGREGRSVRFDEDLPIAEVLEYFERENTPLHCYCLRLGCQHYPHMKLALSEAYFHDEYTFIVDRHDGFDFNQGGESYAAWLGIKSRNFHVKAEIENAWYAAGLPTMRLIKEQRLSQSDVVREFSGQSVLLVDNDADAGAVLQMILTGAGYGCLWAGSIRQTEDILADPGQRARCGMALIDLMLSDGSGIDVVKSIRSKPQTQDIPVLLTSAMNASEVLVREADGYLRKPYSAEHLLKTIADTLRRRYDGHQKMIEDLRKDRPTE